MKLDLFPIGIAGMITVAFGGLMAFEHKSGPDGPPQTQIVPKGQDRLICFVTPDCPCSLSTLKNLNTLTLPPGLSLEVIVENATDTEARAFWFATNKASRSSLVKSDPGGKFAVGLGAMTSGTTIFILPDGQTAFRGGVTNARGESGPCSSLNALQTALDGAPLRRTLYPVYGCSL